ncbi:hypothetical protein LPJ73_001545 [Coemansia sp. RSA 2703]|nr:hypothetical protein LPJ73_001545 [Coemansia sp. RSA 2703]KAJ2375138.1 hypothetical protein IW150_002716 [Coemansia sp. RSA 2607]KAJ2391684.1 hypothetical protein GGI05_002876 [Coemansia sp. RSA 2603]
MASPTPRTSASPSRPASRTHTPQQPTSSPARPYTPIRARPQTIQATSLSAPAPTRTLLHHQPLHAALHSPHATRRSRQSLEAMVIARTLKEGFARLKALAQHPHASPPAQRRRPPMRALSASLARHRELRGHPSLLSARHHSAVESRATVTRAADMAGGVEEAAQAMLFMRTQPPAASPHVLPDDPPPLPLPPPPPPVRPSLTASPPRHVLRAAESVKPERDAYETEEEPLLSPSKRKRTDTADDVVPEPPRSLPRVAELLSQPPSSEQSSPVYDQHR